MRLPIHLPKAITPMIINPSFDFDNALARIAEFQAKPLPAGASDSVGFSPPDKDDDNSSFLRDGKNRFLVNVRISVRNVTPAMILSEAERICDKPVKEMNKEERQAAFEQIHGDLMKTVPAKQVNIPVIFTQIGDKKVALIGTSSDNQIGRVQSLFREMYDTIMMPSRAIVSNSAIRFMTDWVSSGTNYSDLMSTAIGSKAVFICRDSSLKDKVSANNIDINRQEFIDLIENKNMVVTKMEMMTERLVFSLDSKGSISGIGFTEAFVGEIDENESHESAKLIFNEVANAYDTLARSLIKVMS